MVCILTFVFIQSDLFNRNVNTYLVLGIRTGNHMFHFGKLDMDKTFRLYYHSAPAVFTDVKQSTFLFPSFVEALSAIVNT